MATLKHPTLTDVTVEVDEPAEWIAAGWQMTGPEAAEPATTKKTPRRGTTKE